MMRGEGAVDLRQTVSNLIWIVVVTYAVMFVGGIALGVCIELDLIRIGEGPSHGQALGLAGTYMLAAAVGMFVRVHCGAMSRRTPQ